MNECLCAGMYMITSPYLSFFLTLVSYLLHCESMIKVTQERKDKHQGHGKR